jgi:hypothetical protein
LEANRTHESEAMGLIVPCKTPWNRLRIGILLVIMLILEHRQLTSPAVHDLISMLNPAGPKNLEKWV